MGARMVTVAVGTEKGAFLVTPGTSDTPPPIVPGWKVSAFGRSGDQHLAAVTSNWFGCGIQRSTDLAEWTAVDTPPAYPGQVPFVPPWEAAGDEPQQDPDLPVVKAVWTFHRTPAALYAGVEEAGLFRSFDDGATWEPVPGFNEHPTRGDWMPGLGGLCAHRIQGDESRMYVAASAVGVFRSDDDLATFTLVNDGVPAAGMPEDAPRPEVGYCVHGLQADPADPSRLWRQDHMGVFRSTNAGDTWERNEDGLPSWFGFVMLRDHATGRLFTQNLHSDEQRLPVDGRFRIHRSDDDGATWYEAGGDWPDAGTYTQVLRGAVDTDGDGNLAMGTTSGTVWFSDDAGDHWRALPQTFPRITAVAVW